MKTTRVWSTRIVSIVTSVLAVGVLTAAPALSISGGQNTGGLMYLATVDTGTRSCTGEQIAPQWIITAASCFAADPANPSTVKAGPPPAPASARLGRVHTFAPASFNGWQVNITYLVPRPDRDLVLAKLENPSADTDPVLPIAMTAPQPRESLTVYGWGRSEDEWVPLNLKTGTMTVDSVSGPTAAISGTASICKGDAGGPTVRQTANGYELVAIHSRSWQRGCLGETETRNGAVEARVDDITDWINTFINIPASKK